MQSLNQSPVIVLDQLQRERGVVGGSPTSVPNGPGLTDLEADLDLDLRERPLLLKCVGLQLRPTRPTERDLKREPTTCHRVGHCMVPLSRRMSRSIND